MQCNLKAMFAGKREAVELPPKRGPGRPPKVRNKEEGLLPPRAIISITMFVIFCLLFLVQMSFHMFKVTLSIPYLIAMLTNLPGHLPNTVHAASKRSPGERLRRVNRGKVDKSSDVRARRTQELQQPGVRILTEAKIL